MLKSDKYIKNFKCNQQNNFVLFCFVKFNLLILRRGAEGKQISERQPKLVDMLTLIT